MTNIPIPKIHIETITSPSPAPACFSPPTSPPSHGERTRKFQRAQTNPKSPRGNVTSGPILRLNHAAKRLKKIDSQLKTLPRGTREYEDLSAKRGAYHAEAEFALSLAYKNRQIDRLLARSLAIRLGVSLSAYQANPIPIDPEDIKDKQDLKKKDEPLSTSIQRRQDETARKEECTHKRDLYWRREALKALARVNAQNIYHASLSTLNHQTFHLTPLLKTLTHSSSLTSHRPLF